MPSRCLCLYSISHVNQADVYNMYARSYNGYFRLLQIDSDPRYKWLYYWSVCIVDCAFISYVVNLWLNPIFLANFSFKDHASLGVGGCVWGGGKSDQSNRFLIAAPVLAHSSYISRRASVRTSSSLSVESHEAEPLRQISPAHETSPKYVICGAWGVLTRNLLIFWRMSVSGACPGHPYSSEP